MGTLALLLMKRSMTSHDLMLEGRNVMSSTAVMFPLDGKGRFCDGASLSLSQVTGVARFFGIVDFVLVGSLVGFDILVRPN